MDYINIDFTMSELADLCYALCFVADDMYERAQSLLCTNDAEDLYASKAISSDADKYMDLLTRLEKIRNDELYLQFIKKISESK